MSESLEKPKDAPGGASPATAAVSLWVRAYGVELLVFVVGFVLLAGFSGQRFWRQSAAPHFVYQAKAFLDGRQDIDADVLPNYEDWACVRDVGGVRQRCTAPLLSTDRWYSSFPWFPSVVMAPFVALHGYQFNDTSFGVIIGALALALFYTLLRHLARDESTGLEPIDNATLALLLGFGTLFFYAAIRGEVWFSAEVMGIAFTALYLRNAVGAKRPLLAGLCWSMAVLTRTPLFFTGIFFVFEALLPTRGQRAADWKAFLAAPGSKLGPLLRFALGAAPLGLFAAWSNLSRFGSPAEFGHRFFFNNRVNTDIDTWGLFHPHYLLRNLDAAFLKLPLFSTKPLLLQYDAWGLSLFLTLPFLALAFSPSSRPAQALRSLAMMVLVLITSAILPALPTPPGEPPVGFRSLALWVLLAGALAWFARISWGWVRQPDAPRLLVPVLVTFIACMVPGLLYQNTGYAQFGFRFSLDYTPYLMLLVALGRWNFRRALPMTIAAIAVAVNLWGAIGFRGYTELVYHWP